MEGSFYSLPAVATKETSAGPFDPSLAPRNARQQPLSGIYQEEESVDFSALVDACENHSTGLSPVNLGGNSSCGSGPLSASPFFDTSEPACHFELMPGLNVYGNENGFQPQAALNDFSTQPSLSSPPHSASISSLPELLSVSPDQTTGKRKSNKKITSKNSADYREKRDRNNIAVRKSRIKSKQRVQETEKRVKELEDENGKLQNKIALLTKELNVLKGLFTSAGVIPPSIKMEVEGGGVMPPCGMNSD